MHKILLTVFLALTLTSCGVFDWLWRKSEDMGKHMPVSENAQRCEGSATCFGRRAPEQQQGYDTTPQAPASPYQQQYQQPYPQQNYQQNHYQYPAQQQQQGQGGYIPTSLPDYNGDPTMYDEMSKKLPPDMQDSPPMPPQPYQAPYPHYPSGSVY